MSTVLMPSIVPAVGAIRIGRKTELMAVAAAVPGVTSYIRDDNELMVTIDSVRAVAEGLPRSYEVVVRGRVKFRVGQIVWLAFSRDETVMGFAFPKEERNWLIGGSPDKFMLPGPSDLRYNWVLARLAALDEAEMRDLVLDAWRMVVPKRVAAAHAALPER